MHSIGGNPKSGDSRFLLNHSGKSLKVGSHHHGNGGSSQTDESGMKVPGCIHYIPHQLIIIPHDSLQLGQGGYVNHAVHGIPSRLIVGGICGVAAGGIMHHGHASQFIEGRAHP